MKTTITSPSEPSYSGEPLKGSDSVDQQCAPNPALGNGKPLSSIEAKVIPAPSISVVISTLNEEDNIGNVIMSVRSWVTEVIVVDMESDDATPQIARGLGAKVFNYPRVLNFDAARVAGVQHATSDWILLMDADELIPFDLSGQLLCLAATGNADAYAIPRLNYFSGSPLHYAGWGPEQDRQLRFYRRGSVSLNDVLHAHIEANPGTRVGNLKYTPETCILHFNYRDSGQFVSKLNKYTSLTALQRKERGRPRDRSIVLVPLWEFLDRYLRKAGYRSGWRGFYYSFMMAAYRMTLAAKIREIRSGCDSEGSAALYQRIAKEIVSRYESAADHSH
jgi:glycosyltransferase involved in cell wall biosynthesis